ncbi:alpha-hydroxy acid oxidase [Variovorax boronicumulans]
MMTKLRKVLCLDDLEEAARRHLPKPVYGYISTGTEDQISLKTNRAAFNDFRFLTRILVDVSKVSQSVTVFGQEYASPFGLAPVGLSALAAYRGDLVMANAAKASQIPMIVSGSSLIRLETIAQSHPGAWFQAYLPGDLRQIDALIERIDRAGFSTLVITADTPVAGNRQNHTRAGFSAPLRPTLSLAWQGLTHPSWTLGTFMKTLLLHGMLHFENNYATRGAPILSRNVQRDFSDRGHLDWSHFEHIRKLWRGNLVLKGVLHPDDARRARDVGANGIIVSNHGGRQLDGAVSALHMLPRIVRACPEIPIMLDGGFRRGADVLKAVALGARLAFVGRPFIYAAAVGGSPMLTHAIGLLRSEIARNLAMLGVKSPAELTPSQLVQIRDLVAEQ